MNWIDSTWFRSTIASPAFPIAIAIGALSGGCGASFDELLNTGDIGAACRAVEGDEQTESQRHVLIEDMHAYLGAGVQLRPVPITELEQRYGVAMNHSSELRFWEMELDGNSLPDDAVVHIRQVWIGRTDAPAVRLVPRQHRRKRDPVSTADIERLIPMPRGALGQREQLQNKKTDLSSACVATGGLTEFVRLFLSPPTSEQEEVEAAEMAKRAEARRVQHLAEEVRVARTRFAQVERGCDRVVSGMPTCKKLMVEKRRRSAPKAVRGGDFVEFVYSSRRSRDRCHVADRFRVALDEPAEQSLPRLFEAGFVTMNSLRGNAEVLPVRH